MVMMQTAGTTRPDDAHSLVDRDRELSNLFYDAYPQLRSTALAMLADPDLAEEVVMEAFVRAVASWGRLRRLDYPQGYLKKIVLNLCRSRLRRRAIELRVNALLHRRSELSGWEPSGQDVRLDVWNALSRLSPMQRACVVLRYFDDMTDQQVADVLDCSIGTVKSHIFRARRNLHNALERPDGGDRP